MRCYSHIAGLGNRHHFEKLADSTNFSDAGLSIIDRIKIEHRLELPRRTDVLARGNRHTVGLPQLGQGPEILRRPDRFFQPVQSTFDQLLYDLTHLGRGPGTIHIEHDCNVLPGCFPCCANRFDSGFMQLDQAITLSQSVFGALGHHLWVLVFQKARVGRQCRFATAQ